MMNGTAPSLDLQVLLVMVVILQILATIFAIRLIRRTKYNSIWFLCIVGFAVLTVERMCQLAWLRGDNVGASTFIALGVVVSLCESVAVLLADRLVNHIDRLEDQRRLNSRRILSVVLRTEERSRSEFAREMHDGLGPLLSSAKMSLSALSKAETPERQQEIIRHALTAIDDSIRSVREISNSMAPQVLQDFGLARGVRNFISRTVALHGVDVHFVTNLESERFDRDVEVIIYRIICELIHNSLKHSGCTRVDMSLRLTGTLLRLEYADNGCGFNPAKVTDAGMGISNISSRVNSLNGTFAVESASGRGMHAAVEVHTDGTAVAGSAAAEEQTRGTKKPKTKDGKRR